MCSNSRMRRTSRRLIAVLTIFWLLFSQGAMAAHACKQQFEWPGGLIPAAGASMSSDHCAGMMEKAAAELCLKHCVQGTDSNNTASTADVPLLAPTTFLVVEPSATQVPARSAASLALAAHDASPPPLLLSQRLRI